MHQQTFLTRWFFDAVGPGNFRNAPETVGGDHNAKPAASTCLSHRSDDRRREDWDPTNANETRVIGQNTYLDSGLTSDARLSFAALT